MSTQPTKPMDWRTVIGHKSTSWTVQRYPVHGFVQYLHSDGTASARPGRFGTERSAQAAIDRAGRAAATQEQKS